jgi:hypothetical protein
MSARLGIVLIVLGAALALVGLAIVLRVRVPWFGRLPDDIRIDRDGTHIAVPIVSCLVISVILSATATLIALLLRRR